MFLDAKADDPTDFPTSSLDDLDKQIVMQLAEDGRRSYRNIAHNLGIAEGTARFRANRLIEEGYIRVTAVGNALRFGVGVMAITLLRVQPKHVIGAAKRLTGYRNIRFVGMSFGSADVIIQTLHRSPKDLHRFLVEEVASAVPGIISMETLQLAEVLKSSWDWEAWLTLGSSQSEGAGAVS